MHIMRKISINLFLGFCLMLIQDGYAVNESSVCGSFCELCIDERMDDEELCAQAITPLKRLGIKRSDLTLSNVEIKVLFWRHVRTKRSTIIGLNAGTARAGSFDAQDATRDATEHDAPGVYVADTLFCFLPPH